MAIDDLFNFRIQLWNMAGQLLAIESLFSEHQVGNICAYIAYSNS